MNSEVLIPGLEFVNKYNLTQKENRILIYFFSKPYTVPELAKILKSKKMTLHNTIQRLKLKNLLIFKSRDSIGTNLYEFNSKQLEE